MKIYTLKKRTYVPFLCYTISNQFMNQYCIVYNIDYISHIFYILLALFIVIDNTNDISQTIKVI